MIHSVEKIFVRYRLGEIFLDEYIILKHIDEKKVSNVANNRTKTFTIDIKSPSFKNRCRK